MLAVCSPCSPKPSERRKKSKYLKYIKKLKLKTIAKAVRKVASFGFVVLEIRIEKK
jgi:hypothetical protein